MRTYAGHSSAETSNALYRRNLAKGQTGLSVAFDLPTQTGYDPDDELARGEVGRVGVPVSHIGDMRTLFDGIPLAEANTSMTINAPAMWLLALYVAVADEQGAPRSTLAGTTQNDIVKEYLSRGTYVFPPAPSLRLITDMVAWSVAEIPKWNPINICSYHLQEAGATPAQELAYALSTAITVLDSVRDSGQVPAERFGDVVGRISFFVNAGLRFVEEMCKMRALARLWDEITAERYGVRDPKQRRLRYGVQVNSLGLTEAQPENNVQRIVLEMLAVTLSRDARARAIQLPAWNEALGLPRPWDQQWALRMQQVLAYETDLLEYEDLFAGSTVVEAKVDVADGAGAGRDRPGGRAGRRGGRRRVRLHEGPAGLVAVGAAAADGVRRARGGRGEPVRDHRAEPAAGRGGRGGRAAGPGGRGGRGRGDPAPGGPARDAAAVETALQELRDAAKTDANLMSASIACAKAGVTTGEWGRVLRDVFGEFRAPTGVSAAVGHGARWPPTSPRCASGCARPARRSAPGCACWSASPGSTGTPTAPSRWRCGPATSASR